MKTLCRCIGISLFSAALFVPGLHAQTPPPASGQAAGQDQNPPVLTKPLTKEQRKKLRAELSSPYKVWLDEEVPYIITDAERDTFLSLHTNEERENFIESFWLRRDPTPDTPENEFKEEHYRRIAYANEHFASGLPGWKTDRGHIYIIWGKPDDIDAHPSGGQYNRTDQEGGGETETFPFETWHYNYLEGLGNNIDLEFVDTSGSNEYHLTTDPEEKDALLYVPGAGLSELEEYGMADKTQRFERSDGTHLPVNYYCNPGQNDEFARYELAAKIFVAPPVKNKELEALVKARIVRNQLPFDYGFSFLRVTSNSVLVPITIELNNHSMTFQEKDGVHLGTLNIFGRISTPSERVVQTFEDTISDDFPDSLFQQYLTKKSIYGKTIPLSPGLYKLDLVVKDVQSGNVGVISTRLAVPRFDEEKLDSSTLILADTIEKVSPKQVGIGPFVLGDVKVRPDLKLEFDQGKKLGIFLQVYNLKVDPATHKSNYIARFHITKADKSDQTVFDANETADEFKQFGDELTIETLFPLADLPAGKYKIEISVNDKVSNQTLARSQEFTVKSTAAPPQKAAAGN
jgi:GWxTD domain-containing protein